MAGLPWGRAAPAGLAPVETRPPPPPQPPFGIHFPAPRGFGFAAERGAVRGKAVRGGPTRAGGTGAASPPILPPPPQPPPVRPRPAGMRAVPALCPYMGKWRKKAPIPPRLRGPPSAPHIPPCPARPERPRIPPPNPPPPRQQEVPVRGGHSLTRRLFLREIALRGERGRQRAPHRVEPPTPHRTAPHPPALGAPPIPAPPAPQVPHFPPPPLPPPSHPGPHPAHPRAAPWLHRTAPPRTDPVPLRSGPRPRGRSFVPRDVSAGNEGAWYARRGRGESGAWAGLESGRGAGKGAWPRATPFLLAGFFAFRWRRRAAGGG